MESAVLAKLMSIRACPTLAILLSVSALERGPMKDMHSNIQS